MEGPSETSQAPGSTLPHHLISANSVERSASRWDSGNVNPRAEQAPCISRCTDPGRAYFRRPSRVCATSNGRGGCGLELWNVRKRSSMRGRWSAYCRRNSTLAQPCELDFGCGHLLPDNVGVRAHVGVYNCCWASLKGPG
jgi:hypothetical protein